MQYLNTYKDIAIAEMQRTRIPASIKLAQGMLESSWGQSELATVANNHFGIKCGSGWTGGGFYKEDDDRDAEGQLIESCFRKFRDAQESYIAHSDFLTDSKKAYRYGFLFEYEADDYKSWARGLKKAGYATDPKYPQKLISIIEKYDLAQYDEAVMKYDRTRGQIASNSASSKYSDKGPKIKSIVLPHEREAAQMKKDKANKAILAASKKVKRDDRMPEKYVSKLRYKLGTINDVNIVKAKGGETVEQLSAKVGVALEEILAFNEEYIQKEEILQEGDIVYLDRKKRKFKKGPPYHTVSEGETMESISQLYGIRVKSLYAKNRMPKGAVTLAGQKLFLQETAGLSERPKFLLPNSDRNHTFLFEDDPTVK